MNCRQFEQSWNEIFDARSACRPDLEASLEVHASTCERCRVISARYQVLRQAVSAWGPPPVPSAASIERLYALKVPPASATTSRPPSRLRARPRYWLPIVSASAAALLALAWMIGSERPDRPLAVRPNPAPSSPVVLASSRPLETALAEAKEATIDLAREASAPAARIGREVFEFERLEGSFSKETRESALSKAGASASDLFQTVGERVNAGVKPISGSARHAFGFLLGPPPDPDPKPIGTRESL